MDILTLQIAEVKPYWRNPRNNERAVEAVKRSISSYGFNQPLVIDKNNVIIAGHTRYKAMLELGHQTVECVVADLAEDKAREYRIADNKTSEFSEWDYSKLVAELRAVDLEDMKVYFEGTSLDELMKGAGVSSIGDVTAEQVQEKSDDLDNQMSNRSDETQQAMVEVTCPHCAESFFIDSDEQARQLKRKDE